MRKTLTLAIVSIATLSLAACGTAMQDNTGEDEGNDDIVCAATSAHIYQCDATTNDRIPAGWKIVRNANTNPTGSIWINNGSRFTGNYQHKLIKDPRAKENRE